MNLQVSVIGIGIIALYSLAVVLVIARPLSRWLRDRRWKWAVIVPIVLPLLAAPWAEEALWGDGGSDELFGGDGNDQLEGDYSTLDAQYHGDDYLDGEAGDDFIVGDGGADTLIGGDGNNQLIGDVTAGYLLAPQHDGADRLDGGRGADSLWGGGNNDKLQAVRQARRRVNEARIAPRHMARTGYMSKAIHANSMVALWAVAGMG